MTRPNPGAVMRVVFCCLLLMWVRIPVARAQIDAEMVTNMGRNALSVDDYLTAIRYFNQAIESKPYLASPYYYRAYAKFTLEDYLGAEKDCDKSIQLNPFIVEVYQLRGLCRIHNDHLKGAIDDYSRVLSELPDDQGSRYNRALCHLQLKSYAKADSDLVYILKKYPTFYRAYLVQAQSHLEQKDTVQALDCIDRLLVINPKEGNAWSFKGRQALTRGNYVLADSCLTLAIAQMPDDYELYIARAQARHALGEFGKSLADYDRTIELQPTHFVAHYNRGLIRSFVGDLNRAIEDFDFVIGVEPDNTLAIYNRAQLRERTGNYRGAIADYTLLIRIYPNFVYGYMARAALRRKVGDMRGALNDETFVQRHNLDVAFAKNRKPQTRKVRLRSDHELDKYSQLVQEDPDTVRNVFGTLYGKVQNEKTTAEPMPMYVPAFRQVYAHGYHAVGFMSAMNRFDKLDTPNRKFCLTAESDADAARYADQDERQLQRHENQVDKVSRAVYRGVIYAARYNYTSALNEANQAVSADSLCVVSRILRSAILMRMAASPSTAGTPEGKAYYSMAVADLTRAMTLSPDNAYLPYNLGCLYLQRGMDTAAYEAFNKALDMDSRLAEAYFNRALIHLKRGEKDKAFEDFSRAGQYGLYKAYALIKQNK